MSLNIAKDSKKRVVIVGGGFGGMAATLIPAREIGREKEIGSIESGKLADFVVCDEELSLVRVFTGGKQICE